MQRLGWGRAGRAGEKKGVRKTQVQVQLRMLQSSFLVTRTLGKMFKKVLFACEGEVDLSRKLKLLQHISGHLQSSLAVQAVVYWSFLMSGIFLGSQKLALPEPAPVVLTGA